MSTQFKFPDEMDDERNDAVDEQQTEELELEERHPTSPEVEVTSQEEGDAVEIEVVDDTPPEDRGRQPAAKPAEDPTPEELEAHSAKVQKRFRELTRARHDERRRAEAAEREKAELERVARALMEERRQMQEYISMGQTAYIEKAKELAGLSVNAAKAKLAQAYDAGDSQAIAAAQEELTRAQLQLQEANNFRATPLQRQEEPAYNPKQQADRAPATPQIDNLTAQWVSRNPWFQKDGEERMTGFAMGVHAELVRDNGDEFAGTPEYFKEIDNAMRKAFPDRFEDEADDGRKAPAAKRPSTVVAPAQRATAAKKIRLTQTQVDIARRLGVSLEGYAKQLAALEKDNG